jgi:hypothetical protein
MITKWEAIRKAVLAGGSLEEIERQAANYEREVGTVPFNNMIRALNLHPWHNGEAEWTRLAAALTARANKRRR